MNAIALFNDRRRFWGVPGLAIAVVAVGAVYSVALFVPFGVVDDYLCLVRTENRNPIIIDICATQGRQLNGYLLQFFFSHVHRISALREIRTVAMLLAAVLAWAIYRALAKAGWPRRVALLVGLGVVMLPATQVCVTWAICVAMPLAGTAGVLAAMLAARAGRMHVSADRAGDAAAGRWKRFVFAGGAWALLVIGLLIYQPWAMTYWAISSVELFSPRWRRKSLAPMLAWIGLIGAAALATGFGFLKLGLHQYPALVTGPQRASIVGSGAAIREKLNWFVQEPLINSLNFDCMKTSGWFAVLVAGLLASGLLLYFRGSIWDRLWRLAIAAMLVPLAYIPNLMTAENWATYRTQMGLECLWTFYALMAAHGFFWAARRLLKTSRPFRFIGPGIPAAAVLAGAARAAYVIAVYIVWPQSREFKYVQSELTPSALINVQQIVIVQPHYPLLGPGSNTYAEYGVPSAMASWGIRPMVRLLLTEQSIRIPVRNITFDTTLEPVIDSGDPHRLPTRTLILDMRNLQRFRWRLNG